MAIILKMADGLVAWNNMGYLPTSEQIKEEVSNYDELTFFKKIKNILIVFILVMSALSYYINYTTGTFIDVVFAIPI